MCPDEDRYPGGLPGWWTCKARSDTPPRSTPDKKYAQDQTGHGAGDAGRTIDETEPPTQGGAPMNAGKRTTRTRTWGEQRPWPANPTGDT